MTFYRCRECGLIVSEDQLIVKKVCMENYYGVGSMFPDKHYQEMTWCPNCEDYSDFEELNYDEDDIPYLLETIEDNENLIRRYKAEIKKLKAEIEELKKYDPRQDSKKD